MTWFWLQWIYYPTIPNYLKITYILCYRLKRKSKINRYIYSCSYLSICLKFDHAFSSISTCNLSLFLAISNVEIFFSKGPRVDISGKSE